MEENVLLDKLQQQVLPLTVRQEQTCFTQQTQHRIPILQRAPQT